MNRNDIHLELLMTYWIKERGQIGSLIVFMEIVIVLLMVLLGTSLQEGNRWAVQDLHVQQVSTTMPKINYLEIHSIFFYYLLFYLK